MVQVLLLINYYRLEIQETIVQEMLCSSVRNNQRNWKQMVDFVCTHALYVLIR